MDTPLIHNVEVYDKLAKKFFETYEEVTFENVHSKILGLFSSSDRLNVLDVGCGSGRDAVAIKKLGHVVTGVDPSSEMINLASAKHGGNVEWMVDGLPRLVKVSSLRQKYDVILVSAVWMHLSPEHQEQSLTVLKGLLSPGGVLAISWRNKASESQRIFFDVDDEQFAGAQIFSSFDSLKEVRPDVFWKIAVINT